LNYVFVVLIYRQFDSGVCGCANEKMSFGKRAIQRGKHTHTHTTKLQLQQA